MILYRVNPQNIQAAAMQAERAANSSDARDPVSGYTRRDVEHWMQAVASGKSDAHPVAQEMAQGWLKRVEATES